MAKIRSGFIYGLCSEEDGIIRYVGQTKRDLLIRLREHYRYADAGSDYPVNRWVRANRSRGNSISIVLLQVASDMDAAETFWITLIKADGVKLVNATAGGQGLRGISAEIKEKIARIHRGKPKSQEHREKLRACQRANPSLGFKGKKHTEEAKAKFTRKGSTLTAEHRAKIGAAITGRIVSEETRRKIGQSRKGKGHSEETRQRLSAIRRDNPTAPSKPVEIDGVIYESGKAAADALGVRAQTISKWIQKGKGRFANESTPQRNIITSEPPSAVVRAAAVQLSLFPL